MSPLVALQFTNSNKVILKWKREKKAFNNNWSPHPSSENLTVCCLWTKASSAEISYTSNHLAAILMDGVMKMHKSYFFLLLKQKHLSLANYFYWIWGEGSILWKGDIIMGRYKYDYNGMMFFENGIRASGRFQEEKVQS